MIYQIEELVNFAKENSKYYRELYQDITSFSLGALPIINQNEFWKSNKFENNQLLTSDFSDGILFKSGGTSGNPKFSAFTKDEWSMFTKEFGDGIAKGLIKSGDYVGNLFYAGELYASFVFIMKSLEQCPKNIVQFPMTGSMDNIDIVKTIQEYNLNVLVGVPTTFMNLADYMLKNKIKTNVNLILFGGESLYRDQILKIEEAFPRAKVTSIGIASVDGGHLGFFDDTCKNGEHRVFQSSTIVEIIDEESGESIVEPGKPGRLIYTNLTRKLMPIIRYPAGDRAEWIEVGNKFKLHGRSDEGARIGPVTLGSDDILNIFNPEKIKTLLNSFQLHINHDNGLDQVTILLVLEQTNVDLDYLLSLLYLERPMLKKAVESQVIAAPIIKVVAISELLRNERTGKKRLVVDLRKTD
jgi:phenylacetate-CoA ligase